MASLKCAHCSASLPVPCAGITTIRCARCGAVHHADGDVISPRMLPAYEELTVQSLIGAHPGMYRPKLSPWMLQHTRPIADGFYDVRFRDLEKPIVLWWKSAHFYDLEARRVSERTLQSWRGAWE